MKSLYYRYCIVILTVLSLGQVRAAIWRVNNNGFAANFTSINDANNADYVKPGDTLHLEGSSKTYGEVDIRKKMIIIGTGYNLDENQNTTATGLTSKIQNITFYEASSGSQIIGVHITAYGLSLYANNIQIKRCRIDNAIFLDNGLQDIAITQNFFSKDNGVRQVLDYGSDFPVNVVFNNNICLRPLTLSDGQTLGECNNNVFDISGNTGSNPALKFNTGSFRNNILTTDLKTSINNGNTTNIANNIVGKFNPFASINNNIVAEDMTKLFVNATTNSSDGKYQLIANSPGSGKGSDGADIGAFGGKIVESQYTLSGLPPIPVIYSVSSSGAASQSGLPITIKTRIIR